MIYRINDLTIERSKPISSSRKNSSFPISYFKRLGVLRALLIAILVILIAMAPFAGDQVEYSSWKILPSLVAPAFIPILVFVVLFDIVMSHVVMSPDEKEERYGTILWTYVGLLTMAAFCLGTVLREIVLMSSSSASTNPNYLPWVDSEHSCCGAIGLERMSVPNPKSA